jgi:multiple sugar transport system permease protein
MGTIGCLQVFDQIYIMTAGGPLKSTMTLVYLIFTNAFRDFSMGYACALAFIVFFVIFFLTLVQKKYIDVKIEY